MKKWFSWRQKKRPLKSSLQVSYYVTEYWLHQDSNSWLVDLEVFKPSSLSEWGDESLQ